MQRRPLVAASRVTATRAILKTAGATLPALDFATACARPAGRARWAISCVRGARAHRLPRHARGRPQGGPTISSPDEQRHFRQVIGHFPTGVAVITAQGRDGPGGLTANALCSLSLEPLLLLVCLDNTARTLPIIRAAGRFAVNILCHEQHALSGVFASKRPEREKFDGVPYAVRHGVPILDQALAWLVCDLHDEHPGGDHTIGIGAVTEMHHHTAGEPLVWYRGRYGKVVIGERAEARLPN
jgi:3-hydroxy-9,10-secoandrosta-1,3,5(10)-triene-9,17-dione monooxygenase reductase component